MGKRERGRGKRDSDAVQRAAAWCHRWRHEVLRPACSCYWGTTITPAADRTPRKLMSAMSTTRVIDMAVYALFGFSYQPHRSAVKSDK